MKLLQWWDLAAYLVGACEALAYGPRNALFGLGLIFSAACAVLWVIARLQLGRAFSRRFEAHELVTGGLYSRLRHPIYVFAGLAFLGLIVAAQAWSLLLVWLVVALVLAARARREERLMATTFGPQYEAYRRRTWF